MPDPSCPLIARVRASVESRPDSVAVSHAGTTITYRELWDRVLGWRDLLNSLNAPARTVIAVVSNGSPDTVCAFLGVRAARLVPLLIDTLLPPGRREAMMRSARPAAVLDLAAATSRPVCADDPLVLPEGAGYVTFSSGSQGAPKGIVGNADGVARFVDWEAAELGLDRTARVAMLASPSFDVMLREMLLPLAAGGALCTAGAGVRTDPTAVLAWLADLDVNVVHLVPSLATRWVAAAAPRQRLHPLQWTLFAGEPLYARHVQRWRSVAPHCRVVNLYGPSETTLAKFWHPIADPPSPGLQPVGRALPGTRLVSGRFEPVSDMPGGSVQIVIETPDGSLGYLPDHRQDRVAPDLVRHDGVTTFVTQDHGHIDANGLLYVDGRLDGLVKRNGVLVDLARIASDALDDPAVGHACCVQVDVEGSGDVVLAVEGTVGFSLRHLTGDLRRKLGPAMPNAVMVFDPLPLLPNGKVDRRGVVAAVESRRSTTRTGTP